MTLIPSQPAWTWAALLVIALGGGFMRGFSGFGGNLLMTPLMTLMLAPAF